MGFNEVRNELIREHIENYIARFPDEDNQYSPYFYEIVDGEIIFFGNLSIFWDKDVYPFTFKKIYGNVVFGYSTLEPPNNIPTKVMETDSMFLSSTSYVKIAIVRILKSLDEKKFIENLPYLKSNPNFTNMSNTFQSCHSVTNTVYSGTSGPTGPSGLALGGWTLVRTKDENLPIYQEWKRQNENK